MDPMVIVWLILLIAFFLLEAATPQLVSIWFALGSFVSLLTALLGGEVWLQLVLFFGISLVALLLTRPLYHKYLKPKQVATNANALIGQRALVKEEINNKLESGVVRVQGMDWTARSSQNQIIPAGSQVQIDAISGVKLLVSAAEEVL